jgi:calcineurin-like phosphoesterase family protein
MFREPKGSFVVAGDWHGSFQQAQKVIRFCHELELDTIFHVGDFGIWQNDKPYLNQMESLLKEWNIEMYFIDGNHENFPLLYEKKILDDGTRYVRDHITYIPRGYRWGWKDLTFLALGGAVSIDKDHRIEGRSWWAEEALTDEDILTAQSGGPVDVMFTHDSPQSAPNSICDDWQGQMSAMRYFGKENLAACTDHRFRLQEVTDVTAPRLLFHGHYHKRMHGVYMHGDDNHTVGEVYGLDQGLGSLANHTFVFDFDKAKERIEELDNFEY